MLDQGLSMGLSDLFMEGWGHLLPCLSTKGERPLLEQVLGGTLEAFLVEGRDPEVKATQIKPIALPLWTASCMFVSQSLSEPRRSQHSPGFSVL